MSLSTANAARCLAELGNEHRLRIFRLLVRAGPAGLAVGEIQAELGIPKSTLSHHLQHLVMVGLVEQQREGRSLRCRLVYDRAQAVLDFLMEDCCAGLRESAWARQAG